MMGDLKESLRSGETRAESHCHSYSQRNNKRRCCYCRPKATTISGSQNYGGGCLGGWDIGNDYPGEVRATAETQPLRETQPRAEQEVSHSLVSPLSHPLGFLWCLPFTEPIQKSLASNLRKSDSLWCKVREGREWTWEEAGEWPTQPK